MAKGQNWDVWLVAPNQVYRAVPADVVAGWAESGRLAAADKLRVAGTESPWINAKDAPGVGGFFNPDRAPADPDAPAPEIEFDPMPRRREAADDEVDMIPLIDVSLVLLVFFMLTTVVATMPTVDVPEIKGAQSFASEANAVVVQIEKPSPGSLRYTVRPVESAPAASDANLQTLPELVSRLDALLKTVKAPPAVRIAGQKNVTGGEFFALTAELERLQSAKRIAGYTLDVQEVQ